MTGQVYIVTCTTNNTRSKKLQGGFLMLQTWVSKGWKPQKQHMPTAGAMTATLVRTAAQPCCRAALQESVCSCFLALRGQLGNMISLQRPMVPYTLLVSDVAEDDGELEEGETPAADDAEMEAGEDGEYEGALVVWNIPCGHCALFATYDTTSFNRMASGCTGVLAKGTVIRSSHLAPCELPALLTAAGARCDVWQTGG
jgi:hypothetical protein